MPELNLVTCPVILIILLEYLFLFSSNCAIVISPFLCFSLISFFSSGMSEPLDVFELFSENDELLFSSGVGSVEILSRNKISLKVLFNVLLSKVKTADYDISLLEKEIFDILKRLDTYKSKFSKDERVNKLFSTKNEYIQEWFAPNTQKELLCYSRLIKDYTYQDLLRIILSRSARSARLVTHYDLDFPKEPQTKPYQCYKHQRTCQPVEEAYKFLSRYTIDTLDRVKEFSKIKTKAKVIVNHADSREVELPKGIDMVFTSPPYIGLIDYHEQHKYAYELLGLKNNETKEIGPAKNGQSQQAKQDYIKGINDVLLHTRKFMTPKGLALIVVNDKYGLYKAENAGFKEIGRVERHVNRRTGRREGAFYESILIWQKI